MDTRLQLIYCMKATNASTHFITIFDPVAHVNFVLVISCKEICGEQENTK